MASFFSFIPSTTPSQMASWGDKSNFSTMVTRCATLLLAMILLNSCQKWEDKTPPKDPRLDRKYCNNPEAVNYNWDFPGTPDSSVCIFPSDVFAGTYQFYDSVLNAADSVIATQIITASCVPISRSQFELRNFCNTTVLKLTASRHFSATLDTLIPNGQLFCRTADTVSGLFYRKSTDTLTYTLNVWSDTTFNVHKGRAYKQP